MVWNRPLGVKSGKSKGKKEEKRRTTKKACRLTLLAGRVVVVGYENSLRVLLREGGVEPTASFGWRSTREPSSQSRLTTRVVR
jgi:hypothetical protein